MQQITDCKECGGDTSRYDFDPLGCGCTIKETKMPDKLFTCPDCFGDGKETCHNPDHGFIDMLSFHDIGRLGCPVCGHDEHHKVRGGAPCDTCEGSGSVTIKKARYFCDGQYDFEDIMSQCDPEFYEKLEDAA